MSEIVPGEHLVHDVHGPGEIVSITRRPVPGMDASATYAEVVFPTEPTWQDLVSGSVPATLPSEQTRMFVPVYTMMTNGPWRHHEDTLDPYDTLRDLAETHGRSLGSYTNLPESENQDVFAQRIDSAGSATSEVMAAIKSTVDHSVQSALKSGAGLPTRERLATLENYVAKLGTSLWRDELHAVIPDGARPSFDILMVRLSRDLMMDDEGLVTSAQRLLDAVECRVHLVHGTKIRQAVAETRDVDKAARARRSRR